MSTTTAGDAPAEGADAMERNSLERTGDRRTLLKAGAIALAGFMAPSLAGAQSPTRHAPPAPGSHPPMLQNATIDYGAIDPTAAWISPELRLVRRITMGLADADARQAAQLGYDQYLEYHLAGDAISDTTVEQFVATSFPLTTQDVGTLYNVDSNTVQSQLINATVYRSAFSNAQLKQRLVEFWTDHFNIAIGKVGYLKVVDDRDVVRKYAMTTFPQLLKASAHSPAMLSYLDQTTSRKGAPNQNYAREIMELHTLGVDGGYTQTDVAELSRVLTGWTIAGRGTFSFNPSLHDFGSKTVLGVTIPAAASSTGAAAQAEGETILNVLVAHPATAYFVSSKMLRFFLRYDPSEAQVTEVANVYLNTQGDIKAMLRVVLSQANLLAAPAKFKRPYHLVVSGVRALKPTVLAAGANSLATQVTNGGQQPFSWQTPDGFPDRIDYWAGNMLPRWNFGSFLANANSATTVRFDVAPFMSPATPVAIVAAIDKACFGGEMTQRLRDELTTYVATNPTSAARVRETVGLALSSSSFQYF